MDKLPNDILDTIYKLKHELEMKEINDIILYKYNNNIDILFNIILEATRLVYWDSPDVNFTPKDEARIYATLRNMGYIDNSTLNKMLKLIPLGKKSNRTTPLSILVDEYEWMMYNTGPSINELVKSYKNFT